MIACVGTPISWLRLETYAIDRRDAAITDHLATCPACSACFGEIEGDTVALPVLALPEKRRWSWKLWLPPVMAAAAAAVLLLLIIRRPAEEHPEVTTIKGGRTVVLKAVRERAGVIRSDVATYQTGDRWKVTLTCEPGPFVWVDVSVSDPKGVDYPLGPAQLSCGNEIAVPGAFSITGRDVNLVCARLDIDRIPERTPPHPGEPGIACLTLSPE